MTFDPTKPVRCRDGRPARILATDLKGDYPIVYASAANDGREIVRQTTSTGHFYLNKAISVKDLLNIPERRTLYIPAAAFSLKALAECKLAQAVAHSNLESAYTVGTHVFEVTTEGDEVVHVAIHYNTKE